MNKKIGLVKKFCGLSAHSIEFFFINSENVLLNMLLVKYVSNWQELFAMTYLLYVGGWISVLSGVFNILAAKCKHCCWRGVD